MATPPASWELATPIYGIRYPKPTAPAKYLPDAFGHIGADLENTLQLSEVVPPNLAYQAGTTAQRQAAAPVLNLMWIESDGEKGTWIGTGTEWLPIATGRDAGQWAGTGRRLLFDSFVVRGQTDANGILQVPIPQWFRDAGGQVIAAQLTILHNGSEAVTLLASAIIWDPMPCDKAQTAFQIRIRREDTGGWFGGNPIAVTVALSAERLA